MDSCVLAEALRVRYYKLSPVVDKPKISNYSRPYESAQSLDVFAPYHAVALFAAGKVCRFFEASRVLVTTSSSPWICGSIFLPKVMEFLSFLRVFFQFLDTSSLKNRLWYRHRGLVAVDFVSFVNSF